jgi:lycopene beta-cyclase
MSNVMKCDADLIILGGGCAGLSLAMRLAELGEKAPKTLILESRTEYIHDRTWCFWGHPDAGMMELVSHEWNTFSISTPSDRIVRRCPTSPYQMIPSGAFYSAAQERIARIPGIELLLGTDVTSEPSKSKGNGLWSLMSGQGELSAKWIVDTRPGGLHGLAQPHLWQSFLGREIETEEDCFDPDCAELMDFSGSTPSGILFLYLLPFAKNRALVEATVFDPHPLTPLELESPLQSLLEKRLGGTPFSVLRSEHGILPMGQTPVTPPRELGLVRVGLTAGGARPSTGYAFQRIQRWARVCAAAMGEGQPPLPHAPDPIITRAMDDLFLRVLRARPELAPDLFLSLFRKVDPVRMAHFMSDRGRLSDCAVIITALPSAPFLWELPRTLLGSLGSRVRATGGRLW